MNIQTVKFRDLSFVLVTNPGEFEVKYLRNTYGFDSLHLDDYINKTQAPKVEIYKEYALIVLDFPYVGLNHTEQKSHIFNFPQAALSSVPLPSFSGSIRKKRMATTQIDFFVGKDYVVILHEGVLSPINDIFAKCQKTLPNRNEFMGQGTVFLAYRVVDALVDTCFPLLNELYATIDKIDKELEHVPTERTLEEISITRRNIVVFQTMIKPLIPIFRRLEEGEYRELNGAMQPFWSNVLDHLHKIWERLEDGRELIEGISESNESFLTSKTNQVIKVLTIFSAIILPLNLLASLYGMNIDLPFARDPNAFWIIIFVMLTTSLAMLVVFRFKRWF
ncbi:MAG: magnesium transporter CorA family protein [Candidatus Levybacteria bacterium]|nr:magnesium transporter CorA family protein [Candidatus Levybacteria bacterium]